MTQDLAAPDSQHLLLADVVKHIKELPTLPLVAQDLLSNLDDDNISLDEISEKVARDQSLAAGVLRAANSSFYGSNSKVVTIQQAVSMLGIRRVKNLIRLTAISNSFPPSRCRNFDFQAFWSHSIATAECAELISRTLHMKHDFAFTAGLLHDIGRLVLVTRFPAQYEQVILHRQQEDCYLLQAEQAVMGIDHVVAGLALADQWQFSEAIHDAIRGHHDPEIEGLNSVASIVHIANAVVHGLDLSHIEDDLVPLISETAWNTVRLDKSDYLRIFRETEMRLDAINGIIL
ncbi:HDOD domain-containing protein [Undibacterium sp. Jales W-56]|uniref:HDOD domain-containing protein n=1 Tax=Undibacterium sp. Jales W-56 TaxID=2897325 RepID=UPI0021CFA036|nr:HDOD domain-containing protein [Undibacterium sp. Jales W-56]MCU6435737.1 HDOD domain-containing protein [Undibacterium sp. Jales W-56]